MRLGRLAGIDVVIHPTFWLLIGLVVLTGLAQGGEATSLARDLALVAAVFVCVVLHELGHALAARRYGIRTREITLYPIGGIARLERMPDRPMQELLVALAGPLVNGAIAAVLGAVHLVWSSPIVARLALVNVVLVLFNLIPAFPMDGGRVLRACLAMRLPLGRATEIAVLVARALVVPLSIAGLLWNPVLLLIGAFVWFAAGREAEMARSSGVLAGARVLQASMFDFYVLEPNDRLSLAVELTLDSTQKDFPVATDGAIIGALSHKELLLAIREKGARTLVSDVMRSSPPSVEQETDLETAVHLMRSTGAPFLPVVEKGEQVGIVTLDNIEEFARIRMAFGGRAPVRIQSIPLGAPAVLLN